MIRLAEGLTIPLDAVTKTFGILAQRRKGKTYTASVMAEELLDTYLSDLRRNGLADVEGGEVRASDTLFVGVGA